MRQDILIFCGPTILEKEASLYIKAKFLSPAMQGDMYQSYKTYHPKIIGLIDGYFENKASPWHKEILYIMNQGVHVFGASSMGALRASELDVFGMVGIGKIYEGYKNEILIDDDEVAVVHGPSDIAYPALSEAMVNIRETLKKAQDQGIISCDLLEDIILFSKELFYKERNYQEIIQKFSQKEKYKKQIENFSRWIKNNSVNLKKDDAIRMLKYIHEFSQKKYKRKEVLYNFENTLTWNKMCCEVDNILKKEQITC